jgi:copper chaperone CopZ
VVTLRVDMTCEGCVGAVKRILGKMEGAQPPAHHTQAHTAAVDALSRSGAAYGVRPHSFGSGLSTHALPLRAAAPPGVTSYDVDLASKKVVVRGDVTPAAVLERVSKMGKDTQLWTD